MGADYRQQEMKEQEEAEIRLALSRVALGLGGRSEAQILASALGPRFIENNARKEAA